MMRVFFLSLVLTVNAFAADPVFDLPPERKTDWSFAGVHDLAALSASRTVYTNIPGVNTATGGCDTNGVFDCAEAIQTGLDNCPSNQAVVLPAGNLVISNRLYVNVNQTAYAGYRTLRGAGKNLTTIIRKTASSAFATGISGFWTSNLIDAASLYQGSTNIKLFTAPSDFGVGAHLYLSREDENATNFNIVWGNGYVTNTHIVDLGGGTYNATGAWYRTQSGDIMKQAVKCVAISGTNITIWPPLYYSWTNEPGLYAYLKASQGGGVAIGLEDFTITNWSDASIAINFENSRDCWVKNVKVLGCAESLIMLNGSLFCEVRDSDVWNVNGTNISSLAGDKMAIQMLNAHACKIENNSFSGFWNPIMMNSSSSGNAIAYNFFTNSFAFLSLPNRQEADVFGNHIPHCMMNLFEGNVMAAFTLDNYHGSSSHNVLFRNNIHGMSHGLGFDLTNYIRVIDICRMGYYNSIVGNVLGSPEFAARGASKRVYEAPIDGSFDGSVAAIYRLGWPYPGSYFVQPPSSNGAVFIFYAGGTGTAVNGFPIGYDVKVTNTLLRLHNYDFQTVGVADTTTNLPNSFLYASAPDFFDGFTWPPANPNPTDGTMAVIPAQDRFYNGESEQDEGDPEPRTIAPQGLRIQGATFR